MISAPSAAASESLALRFIGPAALWAVSSPASNEAWYAAGRRRSRFGIGCCSCATGRSSKRLGRAPHQSGRPRDRTLSGDEEEQKRADHDFGPPTRQPSVERDQGLDSALNKAAEQCPGDVADAAGQQGPAEHDRGDGVELNADRGERIAGPGIEGVGDAGQRAVKAAKR